jgi:PAS domain S-box-containing protein
MFNLHPTFYGYLLLILGLGLILLIALLLRWLPKSISADSHNSPVQPPRLQNVDNRHAVLQIQPGGKITYLNQGAQDLFKLRGKSPNLENLARCTQPSKLFLNLCAKEGQATFSLNGRLAEGISSAASLTHQKPEILVSLIRPSFEAGQAIQVSQPPQSEDNRLKQSRKQPSFHTLNTLAQISQAISSHLELEPTIHAILDSCKTLLPGDFQELTIWENAAQQPQSFCLPAKPLNGSQVVPSPYQFSVGQGFAAWLVAKHEPLLMDYVQNASEIRPDLDHRRYPYQSYLGFPIVKDRNLIGILEFASLEANLYDQEDLQVLQFFSGQIVIALEHAFLYRREHRKALELSGLADLTQAINAIQEPQDLFSRLVESISPLLDVQSLGFIILDETRRMLKAQLPFQGIHSPSVVEWYQFVLQPGSPAEEIWLSAETINVEDAPEDKRFKAFELDHFTRLAGIHQCVLVPLTTSGQMLGYLLAGNKINGESFDQDDLRFLKIISGKAAPIIENANLVRLSRLRAQRAEVLRRIASLAKSDATIHETLKFSTLDLARLLKADTAVVFMLKPAGQELSLHQESVFGVPEKIYRSFKKINTKEPGFQETICHSQKLVLTGDLEKLDPIPDLYKPFNQDLLLRSLLAIPILFNQQGIGELVLGSQRANHFSNHDVQTAITACELMVMGFDMARYSKCEDRHNTELMEQAPVQITVAGTSHETQTYQFTALQREQLKTDALLRIFTELSTSLDLQPMLHAALKVLGEYVGAHHISIWVSHDEKSELHALAQVTEPPESPPVAFLCQNGLDQELAAAILQQARPILIEDILQEPVWHRQISKWQPSQLYRSVLGAPLINGAETLGCLLLLHPDQAKFSFEQIDLVQAVAYQVSMAINHAGLFRLIHDQAEDFGILLKDQEIETSRSKAILEAVADGVLVTDAGRMITLFNHSAEKILGLQSEKVVGNSIKHFLGLFGAAGQKWTQTIEQWTHEPECYQAGETFSQQIHLDDDRMIAVRLAPVFIKKDFLGTVSIFQDITHQVELDRLKSEFVATVSHELRTPMTSIKGYADILLMGAAGSLSDQQGHFLEIIKSNADRLSILVNDLLDISRIEIGRNMLTLQPLNLEEIIDQTLERYKQLAQGEHKSIHFIKNLPPNLPRVMGDYERVAQILNNLVDNAYCYNVENGSITIQAHHASGEVQIEIQDTGVGIPENELPRVFERFFRGETPLILGVAGTGLGLSIVKNLVEMHHGRIYVESKGVSGEGSRVSLSLPEYIPHQ